MNFKEARKKLKEIAKGRFISIGYEVIDYGKLRRKLKQECKLYVGGDPEGTIVIAPTWKQAFEKLDTELKKDSSPPG